MKKLGLFTLLLLFLCGCSSAAVNEQPVNETTPVIVEIKNTSLPTITPLPPTETPLPTQTFTPTVEILPFCSPLEGIELSKIVNMVGNPYNPPVEGSDDAHQGLDLADRLSGSEITLEGRPVQAMLSGRVAGIILDRFPYGNAVIIETPVENLRLNMSLPQPVLYGTRTSALSCPDNTYANAPASEELSIYWLYGHLQEEPTLQIGDQVICGEVIGKIGKTGNALNPHLHIEARIGPSGTSFNSLAHYDASATIDEMQNYCLWRISGLFRVLDPLKVLFGEE